MAGLAKFGGRLSGLQIWGGVLVFYSRLHAKSFEYSWNLQGLSKLLGATWRGSLDIQLY